jgi:hypothetical protein
LAILGNSVHPEGGARLAVSGKGHVHHFGQLNVALVGLLEVLNILKLDLGNLVWLSQDSSNPQFEGRLLAIPRVMANSMVSRR